MRSLVSGCCSSGPLAHSLRHERCDNAFIDHATRSFPGLVAACAPPAMPNRTITTNVASLIPPPLCGFLCLAVQGDRRMNTRCCTRCRRVAPKADKEKAPARILAGASLSAKPGRRVFRGDAWGEAPADATNSLVVFAVPNKERASAETDAPRKVQARP